MISEENINFSTKSLSQYYVTVFPLSHKYKFSKYSVIKSLFGDAFMPLLKKKVEYVNDYQSGAQYWKIDKGNIDWQLSKRNFLATLSSFTQDSLKDLLEIKIVSRTNWMLGYCYMSFEFSISPDGNYNNNFSEIEDRLDSLQRIFFEKALRQRKRGNRTFGKYSTFKITYLASQTDFPVNDLYYKILITNFMPWSRLPKDPIRSGAQEKVLKDAGPIEKYLYSLHMSKEYAWILDLVTTENKNPQLIFVGSSRDTYGNDFDPYNLRITSLSKNAAETAELSNYFNAFGKGESKFYHSYGPKTRLEKFFDSLLNINIQSLVFDIGLAREIDDLQNKIGGLGNDITRYGKWNKSKLRRINSKIFNLSIKALEYNNRIKAFKDHFSKIQIRKSYSELKIPSKLFPYFDYKDSTLASLNWSPYQETSYRFDDILETKPIVIGNKFRKADTSEFAKIVSSKAKKELNAKEQKVDQAIGQLNELSKKFEPVLTGINNTSLLRWTTVLSIVTIILVFLDVLGILKNI